MRADIFHEYDYRDNRRRFRAVRPEPGTCAVIQGTCGGIGLSSNGTGDIVAERGCRHTFAYVRRNGQLLSVDGVLIAGYLVMMFRKEGCTQA